MLAHGNHPTYTAMERLIQQATVVRQGLNQEHAKVIHQILCHEYLVQRNIKLH